MISVLTGDRGGMLVLNDHIPILQTTHLPVVIYPRSTHHTVFDFWSSNSVDWCTEADPMMIHRSAQHDGRGAPTRCSPALHIGFTGSGQSMPSDLGPMLCTPIRSTAQCSRAPLATGIQ